MSGPSQQGRSASPVSSRLLNRSGSGTSQGVSFPFAFRGYARPQVDAALADLRTHLGEAEQARAAAERRAEQAEAALRTYESATEAELRVRAEEAEQALVAVHEAAVQEAEVQAPEPPQAAALPVERGRPAPPAAVRRPVPVRRHSRRRPLLLTGAAVALLGLVGAGVALAQRDGEPSRTPAAAAPAEPSSSASAPITAPSALAGTTAPQAARAPVPPPVLPAGWTTHRSKDGLWSIGLPPGWKPRGDGFVSASGLTSMSVRTAVLPDEPGLPELEQYERSFAASHAGYRRLSATTGPFRGHRAGSWEYVYGSGALQQRGSDLGVLVGDRGYWLRVVSRASAWRFVEPLGQGFRSSFVPAT